MITLPAEIMTRLAPFAPLFSSRVWRHAQLLSVGAILAPGQRVVSMVSCVLGLSHLTTFSTDHRVLNRAVWSSLAVSRVVLGLWRAAFAPRGPVVVGVAAAGMRPVVVRFPGEDIGRLRILANSRGQTFSALLRDILMVYYGVLPAAAETGGHRMSDPYTQYMEAIQAYIDRRIVEEFNFSLIN